MKKDFLANIVGFSMASWISAALNFFVLPISTRTFAPDELAKVNLFYSVVIVLMNFVCFGLDQGYVRFFSERETEDKRKGLLSVCMGGSMLIMLLIVAVCIPLGKTISLWITGNEDYTFIVWALAICLLNQLVFRYLCLYFRMKDTAIPYTIYTILSSAIIKISYLLAATMNPTGEMAITVMAAISFLFTLIAVMALRNKVTLKVNIKQELNKELLLYCLPLIPVTFVVQINSYIPQYAIRFFGNFAELGVFTTAVTLSSILTIIQSGITTVWSPFVFANHEKKQLEIGMLQKIISLLVIGCGIGLIVFKDLIVLILGKEYGNAVRYLPFLVISPIFTTLGETTGVGTLLKKKGYINLVVSLIAIVVNVVLATLFTFVLGTIGAALSSAITALILFVLKTVYGQKNYKSVSSYTTLAGYVALLLIVAVMNTLQPNVFSVAGIVGVAAIAIIGVDLLATVLKYRKAM